MIDSYGRDIHYLRISLTDRCNLRCRYCMPEEGACLKDHSDMLSEDEMVMAVTAAAELGINKIRITGGEPLVKKNILSICSRIREVPGIKEICLTTNGLLLPSMGRELVHSGVSRVNISLDTLKKEKFEYITRRPAPENLLAGLEAAMDAGFRKIKVNTVLIGGVNDDEIEDIAALSIRLPVDVRFIELMPMTSCEDFGPGAYLSSETVLDRLPLTSLPMDDGVAKRYILPGAKGEIGLISPLSDSFCGCCNRIRLTADGQMKPCLHANEEYELKGLNYAGMKTVIEKAILSKPACHKELSFAHRSEANRNMNKIGG